MNSESLSIDAKRVVAITPLPGSAYEGTLSVVWAVGRRCNYACSYCDKEFHDRVSPHRTFDELRTVWSNIKRAMTERGLNTAAIEFTGGEPTLNPDFDAFVKYLHETQRPWLRMMGLTTNGTQTLEYYEHLTQYIEWICFSTHLEWWDERDFMTKLLDLKRIVDRRAPRATINVNVMYETWSMPQVQKISDIVQAEKIQNLPIFVHNIYGSKGIINKASRSFDYAAYLVDHDAPDAAVVSGATDDRPFADKLLVHSNAVDNPDTQIELDDKTVVPIHSQVLVNLRVDHFPDWRCNAGRDRIFINVDGKVYGGMCRMGEIGEMLDTFRLLDQPVTCDGRACSCMGDVRVAKWKS